MVKKLEIDFDSIEDLGEVPDRVIAERLGCCLSVVWRFRIDNGIPSYASKYLTINWKKVPNLLKTKTSKLVEKLGCSKETINRVKRIRGVYKKPPVDWDSVKDLGKISDEEIAKRYGVCSEYVGKVRRKYNLYKDRTYIDWKSIPDLGKVPDTVIADRLGCTSNAVSYNRKKLGIQACIYKVKRIKKVVSSGGKTFEELAKELNLTEEEAKRKGIKLGIVARDNAESRTCVCGAKYISMNPKHAFCSSICERTNRNLRKDLDLDTNEEVNPQLFNMSLRIQNVLSEYTLRTTWYNNLEELFQVDINELCSRYGVKRKNITVLRRNYKKAYLSLIKQQGKERSNEEEQTEPINDFARQVYDETFE